MHSKCSNEIRRIHRYECMVLTPLKPARGSFLTGKYPFNSGASSNNKALLDSEKTWANVLQDHGYKTSYTGKWHLDGKQKPGWYAKEGREFGFSDNKYRFNTGNWKCLEELSNGRFAAESDLKKCKDLYGNDLSKHYTTDFLFARGMEFIEDTVEEDNMPFALFLSIVDPHSPDIVRQPYDKMYANVDVKVPETTIRKVLRDPAAPLFHYENANAIYNVTLTQDDIEEYHQNIDEKLNLQNRVRQYFGMVKLVDDKVVS